jgi:peptide chain release factor 1
MKIKLTKKDFKINWFSGTGAGGQHRNKHQNCCRITHIETGISATGQNSRSRTTNQREAFETLGSRLISYYSAINEGLMDREMSTERVRTYNKSRNEVIDHKSGLRQSYKYVVDDGNIGDMIESRMMSILDEIE